MMRDDRYLWEIQISKSAYCNTNTVQCYVPQYFEYFWLVGFACASRTNRKKLIFLCDVDAINITVILDTSGRTTLASQSLKSLFSSLVIPRPTMEYSALRKTVEKLHVEMIKKQREARSISTENIDGTNDTDIHHGYKCA